MTNKKHKQKHIALHNNLDELVADWIMETGGLPSQSSILELINWSHKQTIKPSSITRGYLSNENKS